MKRRVKDMLRDYANKTGLVSNSVSRPFSDLYRPISRHGACAVSSELTSNNDEVVPLQNAFRPTAGIRRESPRPSQVGQTPSE